MSVALSKATKKAKEKTNRLTTIACAARRMKMKPYLYAIVDERQLKEMLETFSTCLEIPSQVLDEKGHVLMSSGSPTSFCTLFKKHLPNDDSCQAIHAKASKKAMELGEPYIFACHAGLYHIVFPLVNKNALFGSILAGPFLMDEPDSLLINDIAERYTYSTQELLELYDESSSIRVFPPARVTYVSRMLFFMFSGLISDSREQLQINQHKLHQQSQINESIQMYKNSGTIVDAAYPYDKERLLITKLKTGDVADAKSVLNDLLGYVFFSKGNDLEFVKSRSVELCSVLSRAAIESGATSDSILKVNNQLLSILPQQKTVEDLCYKLQEAIDVFTDCMFKQMPSKNSDVIKKAIQYISQNFSATLTLENVANYVHLNSTYFSTLFKQSTGSSFKEYLNMVRIEESKRLLANTDYSLMDIAIATGFEDQSYFSKVFKKYTGLTPKQFR